MDKENIIAAFRPQARKHLTIETDGRTLTLRVRGGGFPMKLLGLALLAAFLVWALQFILQFGTGGTAAGIIRLVMLAGLAWGIASGSRKIVASMANNVQLTVAPNGIRRQEGPIILPGRNWDYSRISIEGLYVQARSYRRRGRPKYTSRDLIIRLKSGEEYIVFPSALLVGRESARDLEQILEKYLDLEHVPIAGEYEPDASKRPRRFG